MTVRPFRLADHVHACFSARGTVLLDVRRDAYVGLDVPQTRALAALVDGWPRVCEPAQTRARDATLSLDEIALTPEDNGLDADAVAPEEALAFAMSLQRRGLLVLEPASPRAPMATLAPAETQLISWDEMTPRVIRAGHVVRFVKSMLVVIALLKLRSFSFVVTRAARRRARTGTRPHVPSLAEARALLGAFYHIRPFFYGKKNRCLLDSATLLEFLACYDVYPQWVIGVQVQPFAAHSWVQHEAWVLNGTPEFVRMYEPILVV